MPVNTSRPIFQTSVNRVPAKDTEQIISKLSFICIRKLLNLLLLQAINSVKKGSPYSITERRVPELIPVLGSQPASDVSHKPGGKLPLLSAGPAVTPATIKRAATNFAAW